MSNLIGQTLLGQFRVDSFIASGGMGAVYRVWDTKRNVALAMKVLHAEVDEDPSAFKYFQREARALQKLAHPNIVPFYGLYQESGLTFMLQHFIDGASLREILRQNPSGVPISEALAYVKALCSALGYAHANGVVHCDLKPNNVMVDLGGQVYLADFGIARHAESAVTTIAGAGTPAYMAPEQIRGEPVVPATDIYALGVLFFELLVGQRPFRGDEPEGAHSGNTSGERIRYAHLNLQPPDPFRVNSSVPPAVASIILKCLSKAPAERFASTAEVLAALKATGLSIPERVPIHIVPGKAPVSSSSQPLIPGKELLAPTRRRNPLIIGLVIVLGIAFLFGSLYMVTASTNLVPQTEPPVSEMDVSTQTAIPLKVLTEPSASPTPMPPSPSDTPLPPPTDVPVPTRPPTNPPQPEFTARANMFCREGPATSYDKPWQLSSGEVVSVIGVWHQDSSWLLVNIDSSKTRTDCCWVGGEGSLNVDRSSLKPIYTLPDRLDCSSVR